MIGIVDYNMGNLASVVNALKKIGADAKIVKTDKEIQQSSKLILPGVGAFGDAMSHLKEHNLDESLKTYKKSGNYMLGICLGMQLLFEKSEEFGSSEGLGLIEGEVVYFNPQNTQGLKIPHMGWNRVELKDSSLTMGLRDPYLYFVHSLHVKTDDKNVIGYTTYGDKFASMVNSENVFGIQPHPEKSHENGLKILSNFVGL